MNGGAKYYLAFGSRTIIHYCALIVFVYGLVYAASRYYGSGFLQVLRIPLMIGGAFILCGLLNMLQIIRLNENGIIFRAILRKKKVILWEDVCCCGYFFHYTYKNRKRKFYYFSTKPLPGGVNYLSLITMAKPTDSFLYVAEQRDVEAVIKQFYPRFRR